MACYQNESQDPLLSHWFNMFKRVISVVFFFFVNSFRLQNREVSMRFHGYYEFPQYPDIFKPDVPFYPLQAYTFKFPSHTL